MGVLATIKQLVFGIVFGVLSWAGGVVATYVWKGDAVDTYLTQASVGPTKETWVGWLYYGAQQVDITSTQSAAGETASQTFSMQNVPFWDSALQVVPPLALVVGGFLLGRTVTARDATGTLTTGLALGYVGMMLAGVVLFMYGQSVGFAAAYVHPEFQGTVVMGAVYGFVAGGVGVFVGQSGTDPA